CGFGLIVLQALIVGLPSNGQVAFWGYATVGLPALFTVYFLLGVPAVRLATHVLVAPLSRLLGLPARYLRSTLLDAPFRHGFTAGAMMAGLALMVALWTNGGAIMRDWLGRIEFPDAFVNGPAMTEDHQRALDDLPFVRHTCAISLLPVETDVFGVRALQKLQTTFIAFQPDRFFEMTTLTWIEGNEADARRRLDEGGAILVAKEFRVAQGLGVGDTFACTFNEVRHEFEIVGVITSPGLEVASKFFNIGSEYAEQSVHAIFGTRRDLEEKLVRAETPINLFQIDLDDDVDEAMAIDEIRAALADTGILDAGSGRQIKEEIRFFTRGILLVVSVVAVSSMLVACFGVANLIIAGIEHRRFSFGVLRAVGGQRALLVRLVI
ncbi:MAG: hypothetical protein KDA28_08975, partial [Phycisphaerales bacterium]|nr:hypothetical protein [Phycisphaerales bacterium]